MRKPKSSNVLLRRKNFVKSVRKQYGNPDSHPFLVIRKQTKNQEMIIQNMTKLTHVKITLYIGDTIKNTNERNNACCTLFDFPRDLN